MAHFPKVNGSESCPSQALRIYEAELEKVRTDMYSFDRFVTMLTNPLVSFLSRELITAQADVLN